MRLLLILLPLFLCLPLHAQEMDTDAAPAITYPSIEPDPHDLKKTGTARVMNIIDALRLQLDDKRIIQLSALDIPDLHQPEPGEVAFAAKEALEKIFKDKKINIYQSIDPKKGRTNRMGHSLAHITRADDHIWAQGALLSLGLARVRTTSDNRALAKQMYEIEQDARDKALQESSKPEDKPNLWTQPDYKILTPTTAFNARRTFQIVEGTIRKVAIHKNRYYLNFGDRWQTDFTISIAPEHRRLFSKEGFEPLKWANRTVRVRGWMDEYNGPYIDIDHPERIEFIDEEQPNEESTEEKVTKDALPDIKDPRHDQQNRPPAGRS